MTGTIRSRSNARPYFLQAILHNTHCSPSNRKPAATAQIKAESTRTLDISKGAITLKPRVRIAKTTDNTGRKAMSRLSFSRKLASSPSPRYHASCARSAARHASFAESAPLGRSAPCKNKNSDFFATFFRLGTLSCSHKAKTGRFAADLLRFRADIPALPLRNSP